MSAQHTDPGGAHDDFDALTDLFLGAEPAGASDAPAPMPMPELKLTSRESDDEPAGAASTPIVTEALVLGHLPVRANPWVAQYARAVAQRTGERVALVRMGGGQMGIDLYGLDAAFRECHSEETVGDALARVARSAGRVVFQVQDADEVSVARSGVLGRVTILTAGNDAAVVSVYRTIKSIADAVPEIGIAVMGEGHEKARRVIGRLDEAARAFLDVRVVESGIIDKMGPTGGAMVYLGECELGHESVASRLAELRRAGGTDRTATGDAPAIERTIDEPDPDERMETSTAVVDWSPPRVDRAPDDAGAIDHTEEDARALALSVLELKPVGASCPDDEGVVIARDESGGLHLVCEDEERRGIERLTAVSSWASKHAKLLRALDVEVVADRGVVRHLLTREPRAVRHLLDTDVRVHVMRRADERIGTGWMFVELN